MVQEVERIEGLYLDHEYPKQGQIEELANAIDLSHPATKELVDLFSERWDTLQEALPMLVKLKEVEAEVYTLTQLLKDTMTALYYLIKTTPTGQWVGEDNPLALSKTNGFVWFKAILTAIEQDIQFNKG